MRLYTVVLSLVMCILQQPGSCLENITCYKCDYPPDEFCLEVDDDTATTNCSECYTSTEWINETLSVTRGCKGELECNSEGIPGGDELYEKCCDTNLCNNETVTVPTTLPPTSTLLLTTSSDSESTTVENSGPSPTESSSTVENGGPSPTESSSTVENGGPPSTEPSSTNGNDSTLSTKSTTTEIPTEREPNLEIRNKNSKFRNMFLNYLFNDTNPLYNEGRYQALDLTVRYLGTYDPADKKELTEAAHTTITIAYEDADQAEPGHFGWITIGDFRNDSAKPTESPSPTDVPPEEGQFESADGVIIDYQVFYDQHTALTDHVLVSDYLHSAAANLINETINGNPIDNGYITDTVPTEIDEVIGALEDMVTSGGLCDDRPPSVCLPVEECRPENATLATYGVMCFALCQWSDTMESCDGANRICVMRIDEDYIDEIQFKEECICEPHYLTTFGDCIHEAWIITIGVLSGAIVICLLLYVLFLQYAKHTSQKEDAADTVSLIEVGQQTDSQTNPTMKEEVTTVQENPQKDKTDQQVDAGKPEATGAAKSAAVVTGATTGATTGAAASQPDKPITDLPIDYDDIPDEDFEVNLNSVDTSVVIAIKRPQINLNTTPSAGGQNQAGYSGGQYGGGYGGGSGGQGYGGGSGGQGYGGGSGGQGYGGGSGGQGGYSGHDYHGNQPQGGYANQEQDHYYNQHGYGNRY